MSVANQYEMQMLDLINAERAAVGLNKLKFNGLLNDASEDHSEWMLDEDRFSHTGENGSSPHERMEKAKYPFEGNYSSGENIAWQSERGDAGIADDVKQLHEGLMQSPGHRANILNPDFTEIGIGIEEGDFTANGGTFDGVMVTQNFASTDADTSKPDPQPEPEPQPEPQPETPEVPETPETPEVPETPETPEVPETPETPEVPETPETPEVPETPDTGGNDISWDVSWIFSGDIDGDGENDVFVFVDDITSGEDLQNGLDWLIEALGNWSDGAGNGTPDTGNGAAEEGGTEVSDVSGNAAPDASDAFNPCWMYDFA